MDKVKYLKYPDALRDREESKKHKEKKKIERKSIIYKLKQKCKIIKIDLKEIGKKKRKN